MDMNRQLEYQETLDRLHFSPEQKSRLAARVAASAAQPRPGHRPIWKIAVTAACLALLLAGTTLAAVGSPATLAEWFHQQWQESSGAAMPEAQVALIETLTQPVGISDTQSGVTVTLDSITVGDSCLWLLLKVDSVLTIEEEPHLYHFGHSELEFMFDPDTVDTPGGISSDYGFVGIAGDGRLTLLMRQTIPLTQEDSLCSGHDAILQLENLMYSDSVCLEGHWTLPFSIAPVELEVRTLERALVPARDHEHGGTEVLVELTGLQVSATGVRWAQQASTQSLYPSLSGLLMTDGTVIPYGGGGSRWLGDIGTGLWVSDYYWQLPVDLTQVTALKFESTEIPLTP